MLALRELPPIYFSFSLASHHWSSSHHNLRLWRCGPKAENMGPQQGFRDWRAGTHSTDRALDSERLSTPPRSQSKLLSEPAGPAHWPSITVKACLPESLFPLCLRPARFKVCPGDAGTGFALPSSVHLDAQCGSLQLNPSETFSDWRSWT